MALPLSAVEQPKSKALHRVSLLVGRVLSIMLDRTSVVSDGLKAVLQNRDAWNLEAETTLTFIYDISKLLYFFS